jgi:hypothetical protein
MTGRGEKVGLAKKAASEITQNEFEQEMQRIYEALEKCNSLAFH